MKSTFRVTIIYVADNSNMRKLPLNMFVYCWLTKFLYKNHEYRFKILLILITNWKIFCESFVPIWAIYWIQLIYLWTEFPSSLSNVTFYLCAANRFLLENKNKHGSPEVQQTKDWNCVWSTKERFSWRRLQFQTSVVRPWSFI